ncbi:PRC-barrel domain-containing protein [Pseudoroseicyclus aestuarii]|uniref:PRC-barrel domain protein n=1 Tax=Pseudoroseicyclus aestuarii TaxID=1795041 RepID=A0A318SRW2_9RHOB|nr:PRC-barrel domain-containing protein [Pseudoroseicyclus aestuarii]PYE84560.1 PRC-barrel domain protein [Pseudoroseicyclus aestuarii]
MPDTAQTNSAVISSDRVNGTEVYGVEGGSIGHIDHLLIDKKTGRITYAMMGFGGFMGLGEDYYPIPWAKLDYDPGLAGYRTDITREQIEGAPERRDGWYDDRKWEEATYAHYGAPYYWI